MSVQESIVNEIKELRKRNNITQEQLSRLSGVPFATINRLENGKGNPTLSTLQKILDVFGYQLSIVRKPPTEKNTNG